MRVKAKWQRPTDNFWISSVSSVIDIERTHRDAGFPAIDEGVVRAHYCQFLSFLETNGMTTRALIDPSHPVADVELRNHDLTELGFEFVRRYHDRWIGRLYKLKTPEAEKRFLEKWRRETTIGE
jgi:hypothetical protein